MKLKIKNETQQELERMRKLLMRVFILGLGKSGELDIKLKREEAREDIYNTILEICNSAIENTSTGIKIILEEELKKIKLTIEEEKMNIENLIDILQYLLYNSSAALLIHEFIDYYWNYEYYTPVVVESSLEKLSNFLCNSAIYVDIENATAEERVETLLANIKITNEADKESVKCILDVFRNLLNERKEEALWNLNRVKQQI